MPNFSISEGFPSGPTTSRIWSPASRQFRKWGGLAGRLHHNVNGAALRIRALDGQRDPFALLVKTQNDELTRLLLSGNSGSFHDETLDSRRNKGSVNDLEQGHPARSLRVIVPSFVRGGGDGGHFKLRLKSPISGDGPVTF